MAQLNILPSTAVIWGQDILAGEVGRFPEYGIEQPIVLSVGFLDAMRETHVAPCLKDAVGTFLDLPAHAPDTAIEAALERAMALGARSIVAHGGGSVLDAAKAVSHRHHERTGRFLPIAALPTTLSGSEFSHYFGVTETTGETRFKRSYAVRQTVPQVVVLDPVLLVDTPRSLLLSSAVKGLDHAVEGMRTVDVDHPHAIMAASGLRRFLTVLEAWPGEHDARTALDAGLIDWTDLSQLQLAAWHSYFAPASVVYGLSHRIGHILGGTYELPHSMTSCLTLAPVIRACAPFYGDKLAIFDDGPAAAAAGRLADRIEQAVARLRLPTRVGNFGLERRHLPDVADLLRREYPREVADLGENADERLDALLGSIW